MEARFHATGAHRKITYAFALRGEESTECSPTRSPPSLSLSLSLFRPPAREDESVSRYRLNSSAVRVHTPAPGTLMSKRCCRLSIFYSFHEEKRNIGRRFYAARSSYLYVYGCPRAPRRPAILHFRFVKCYKVGGARSLAILAHARLSPFPVCDLLFPRRASPQRPNRSASSASPIDVSYPAAIFSNPASERFFELELKRLRVRVRMRVCLYVRVQLDREKKHREFRDRNDREKKPARFHLTIIHPSHQEQ